MQRGLKFLTLLIIFVVSSEAGVDMGKTSQEADAAMSDSAQKAAEKEYTANDAFGYAGTSIPEATHDAASIESAKFAAASQNEAFNLVKESIDQRQPYDMDVVKDPLFKESNQYLNRPGGNLRWKEETVSDNNQPTHHKCTRGRQVYEARCHLRLVAKQTGTHTVTKTKYGYVRYIIPALGYDLALRLHKSFHCNCLLSGGGGPITDKPTITHILDYLKLNEPELTAETVHSIRISGHNNECSIYSYGWDKPFDAPGLNLPNLHTLELSYNVMVPSFELVWEEDCKELESLLDQGRCAIVSTQCFLDTTPTKTVDGITLTADCWEKEITYRCHSEERDNCKALLEKGCIQVASRCQTEDQGECIEWEQTFECSNNHSLARSRITGKDIPFCLDGDCVNQSWAPNQDMADSLSKLAIFKEMQKDMDPNTQSVFKGKPLQCSRIPASFKNCCVQKGWGMKVGLASCNAEEKDLAQQRKLNKCIQVGTYCAQKRLGVCTKKKTSFCCYQTKLARIVNEQGRSQLDLGFGSAKHPQCDALTLAHFTQIDFGKINFSELFQDIMGKVNLPNTTKISQGIQQSLSDQSRLITDRKTHITQGRKHGEF